MAIEIKKTEEFDAWFEAQTAKEKAQIDKRLDAITEHGHFGDVRQLDEIAELKWKSGRRVYFGRIESELILLLTGGNKNGQDKDIKQAKAIFARYVAD